MATEPDSTIRLLAPYRGREAGSVITGLTYGAAQVLVELRRLAEWAPGADGYPLGSPAPVRNVPQGVPAGDRRRHPAARAIKNRR
jgi:hypothetical protein